MLMDYNGKENKLNDDLLNMTLLIMKILTTKLVNNHEIKWYRKEE